LVGTFFACAKKVPQRNTGRLWERCLCITARRAKSANSSLAEARSSDSALFCALLTGCMTALSQRDPPHFSHIKAPSLFSFQSIQSNYPSPRLPLEALAKWGGRVLGEGASGGGLLSLTDRHLYVIKAGSRFRIQHEPCVNRDQLHDRLADFEKHLGRKGDSGL